MIIYYGFIILILIDIYHFIKKISNFLYVTFCIVNSLYNLHVSIRYSDFGMK